QFETDRAPYLVKSKNGEVEIPWREATRVRSAKRADLLRLLVPRIPAPEFELCGARLIAQHAVGQTEQFNWLLVAQVYLVPHDPPIVLPRHKATAACVVPEFGAMEMSASIS